MRRNDDVSYHPDADGVLFDLYWERISLVEWLPRTDSFRKLLMSWIENGEVPLAKLVYDQDRQETTIERWRGPPPSGGRLQQLILRDLQGQWSNDDAEEGRRTANGNVQTVLQTRSALY